MRLRDDASVQAPILIVDDRQENRLAFSSLLAPLGQEVVEASSGDEALRLLLQGRFSVVLLDVEMPGLSGLETAALIRNRPATSHLPIIFVTAQSHGAQDLLKGYSQGAVDYLLKPIDPDILCAKVKSFVDLFVRGELLRVRERELAERRRAELEAQRAAEFEQQASAIMGHDIRNPLAVIRATAQLGLRTSGECGRHEKAFARILASTQQIQRISETFLDFTRVRVGQGLSLRREQSCIAELARKVLQDFETVHPSRRFRLLAPDRIEGHWDPTRLAQVLTNLLDNALKHGDPQGEIRVEVRPLGDSVELCVENDGAVVDEARLAKLFAPYASSDLQSGRRSLGLGLFIVREITCAHGGEVCAERIEDRGMRFRVTIPTNRATAELPSLSA